MESTISYLNNIGCAEAIKNGIEEYWFRVQVKGKWNGMWCKSHKGEGEQKSTEELARYMNEK